MLFESIQQKVQSIGRLEWNNAGGNLLGRIALPQVWKALPRCGPLETDDPGMACRRCRGRWTAYAEDEVPARYSSGYERGGHVSKSVLDAIREGDWHFEPEQVDATKYQPTTAVPGSRRKLDILAARARAGLPLWHQDDCTDYEQYDVE